VELPFEQLTRLATKLQQQQLDILEAEEEVVRCKRLERNTRTVDIPELLSSMGVQYGTTLELADDLKLEYSRKTSARVSEGRMENFIDWCDANGHGGMVKREVRVAMGKDSKKAAKELIEKLRQEKMAAAVSGTVHWATLDKWTNERLEEGKDVPKDLMNIHQLPNVKLK